MLDRLTGNLQFQGQALLLRAERQKVLSGNIANADTPGFQARDFDFAKALQAATTQAGGTRGATGAITDPRHLPVRGAGGANDPNLLYRLPEQPSIDGNTVDMDRERANFADNTVRYEATLRFINGDVRNLLSAIRGD
ncbi:MAG: flagellar basal body rod protein FlgB [Burkholderiaceae bacterium]